MGLPKTKNASTSEEPDDTITASTGLKRKRRRTSMQGTVNRALRGKKAVVEFNPKGVPFGKVASEMASYIGVLARTTVPISVESWPKVDKNLKNEIWKSVEGPKQPSNMECGYYVMRYMKEIIEGQDLSFATKWDGRKLNAYTQTELDEENHICVGKQIDMQRR
ncbi:hypothetical protein ACLB2K_001665 [Fragaria x ananassa]